MGARSEKCTDCLNPSSAYRFARTHVIATTQMLRRVIWQLNHNKSRPTHMLLNVCCRTSHKPAFNLALGTCSISMGVCPLWHVQTRVQCTKHIPATRQKEFCIQEDSVRNS